MKRGLRLSSILLLCLSFLLSMIPGCGLGAGKTDVVDDGLEPPPPIAAFDTSKEVHQVWVVPGDKPQDLDLVYAEVNKTLKKEINTTLELKYVPWQTWMGNMATLLAADNPPDAMYVSSWANYSKLASQNLLREIDTDQLAQYAPKISADLSAYTTTGLQDCQVGGKAYMVPAVGNLWVQDWPVLIRGDLRAKFGLPEIRTLDDLDEYLKTLGSAQNGIIPWNTDGSGLMGYLQLAWYQPNGMDTPVDDLFFLAYALGDKKAQIRNVLEEKTFTDALLRLHNLAMAGAVPENVLYSRVSSQDNWNIGQSACMIADIETISSVFDGTLRDHPEWKPERYLLNPEAKRIKQPVNTHGMAMPVGVKEPERFLMALDLLYDTKSLQDLTSAGLVGTHRAAGSENAYEPGPDARKYPFSNSGVWAWSNRVLQMAPSANGWYLKETYDKWISEEGRVAGAELGAFVFDPAPVSAQLSKLQTALSTEGRFLLAGASDSVSNDMKTLLDAFMKAGLEDVRTEMQRQADLFLQGH